MENNVKNVIQCFFNFKERYIDFNELHSLDELKSYVDTAVNNGATHFNFIPNDGAIELTPSCNHRFKASVTFNFVKYDKVKLKDELTQLNKRINEIEELLK